MSNLAHNARFQQDCEKLEEALSKESLKYIVWELRELASNKKLFEQVLELVIDAYVEKLSSNVINDLLDELVYDNLLVFIGHLGLEAKIRKMVYESYVSKIEDDYE